MTQSTPPHLLLPGIPLGPTTHVGVPGPQAPALARRELRSLAGMGGSPRRDAAGPREPGGQLGFGVKGIDPRIKLALEIVEKELDRPLLVNIYSSYGAANRPSNFPASFNVPEPMEPAPPTPPPMGPGTHGLLNISAHSPFGGPASATLGNNLADAYSDEGGQ